ncbi:DUF3187 family protein [Parahaliea mediterranea]|uniref:DUF3187 family protein n=1 Tax=Parahaliea mediterranea TaxID=651086 RepID=A0A939DHQ8_9GAMM|nr:DUF3187 family protein [Parahaliea mediterranea]
MTQKPALFGALLSALVPAIATAADPLQDPLHVRNISPVTGLVGLPAQRAATTTPSGTLQWTLHAAVASHYVSDRAGVEQLNLDGETQRLALELRYGLAEGWDVQLELPWLRQDGGALDGAIDGWHEFWGMPDNGRGDAPRDRIDYRYADPDLRFAVLDSGSGIGDGSLALQRRLYRDGGVEVAASLGYKFGSGDVDDFSGSGEGDVYAALRVAGSGDGALGWYGQAGYLRAGEIAELGPRQERDLWFAGAGLAWRLSPSWSLLGQLDAHAAPMDSALDALGGDAVMLSAGARWRFAPRWAVDVSLVEDIAVETAPDVIFQASLRYLGAGTP